jgi:tetratricopeptide (TPR) repeat protein
MSSISQAREARPGAHALPPNRGAAYAAKGDYDRAIAEFTEAITLDPSLPPPTTTAALPATASVTLTVRSRTSTRRFRSIRNLPFPTTTAAMSTRTRATTTARSRTSPRRSRSTRNLPAPTTTVALPTRPRATTSARLQISIRRSGSTCKRPSPSKPRAGAGCVHSAAGPVEPAGPLTPEQQFGEADGRRVEAFGSGV